MKLTPTTQQTSAIVDFTFTAIYTGDELIDDEFDSLAIDDVEYRYADLINDFGQHGADGLVQIGRAALCPDMWARDDGEGMV